MATETSNSFGDVGALRFVSVKGWISGIYFLLYRKPLNQNKMTAVEQMIDEFNEELKVAIEIGNEDKIRTIKYLMTIATLYLPKEADQIVNAWDNSTHSGDYRTGKEYYEETFKSE